MKPYLLAILILFKIGSPLMAQEIEADTLTLPNIVLIVIDDMGWNDVSYHGSEIRTPTMDRLAKEGIELNRFYVHPACSPTRSALMTGKAAVRLGFVNPLGKNNVRGLPLSEKIMPQYFQEKGYSTNLVGKWHLGRFKKEYWPYNRGFDHFYGYLTGGIGHYDHIHGGGLDWQRNGETIREEGYSTHLLTDEAIKIIQNPKSAQPFFLELCYAAPHMPNEAPAETVATYQHIDNENRRLHAAMVTEVDVGIQRIYETLESTGQLDNTIIWVMSDNGGQNKAGSPDAVLKPLARLTKIFGEPIPFPFLEFVRDNVVNGAADNSPLKGGKNTTYEGGIRVPAFIYAPKFLQQQKIDQRVTVNDVLPTLASAIGSNSFDQTAADGISQWQYLKQEAPAPSRDFIAVSRFNQAYFRDGWKLVLPNDGEAELYKPAEDPSETANLAPDHPEIVGDLKAALQDFPRGATVDDPLWKVFVDPDLFGGKEDREPFAGVEGKIAGPLHPNLYLFPLVMLAFLSLVVGVVFKLIQQIRTRPTNP